MGSVPCQPAQGVGSAGGGKRIIAAARLPACPFALCLPSCLPACLPACPPMSGVPGNSGVPRNTAASSGQTSHREDCFVVVRCRDERIPGRKDSAAQQEEHTPCPGACVRLVWRLQPMRRRRGCSVRVCMPHVHRWGCAAAHPCVCRRQPGAGIGVHRRSGLRPVHHVRVTREALVFWLCCQGNYNCKCACIVALPPPICTSLQCFSVMIRF